MSKMFKAVFSPITALLGAETPPAPEVKEPALMPDPDDPRIRTLARRNAAKRSATGGRDSTRLSGSDTTFSNTQL